MEAGTPLIREYCLIYPLLDFYLQMIKVERVSWGKKVLIARA